MFEKVKKAMGNSNFICEMELTDEVKKELYVLMKGYKLNFTVMNLGPLFGTVIELCETKDSNGLTFEEITRRELDQKELEDAIEYVNNMQESNTESEKTVDDNVYGKYGWLAPDGTFIEAHWGEHDDSALDIIDDKGLYDEYEESPDIPRDFISKKGYCLIHSPSRVGYSVTNLRPLTKRQKDFLVDYFYAVGDKAKAEMYIDND